MTVTIPTASSIKMRFPEFNNVEDSIVEFAIEEARLEVGDNWEETTVGIALIYLVAHYVAASVSRAASGGSGDGVIQSESIGRLSITYASGAATADATDKDTTAYGRRYLEILGANFAGPVII